MSSGAPPARAANAPRAARQTDEADATKSDRLADGAAAVVNVIAEARARGTAPVAAEQIGRDAAFIEEDILAHVAQRLPRLPLAARRGDIRPALLVGVYRFFYGESQAIDRPPQRAKARGGRQGLA